MKMIKNLAERFKEPSSWAGLAGLAVLVGFNLDPNLLQSIVYVGAGLAGLGAVLLPEGK